MKLYAVQLEAYLDTIEAEYMITYKLYIKRYGWEA